MDVTGVILVRTRRERKTSQGVLHSSLLRVVVMVLKSPDSGPPCVAFTEISSPKFIPHFDTWQSVFVAAGAPLLIRNVNIAEDNIQDTTSEQKITTAL